MNRQPNRLQEKSRHGFGGGEIDRGRPLTFRLNGLVYEAFEGDTILSAVLAAGVDTAGQRGSDSISLESGSAPFVVATGTANDPATALPMDRAPALPGLDLVTIGPRLDPLPRRGLGARIAALVRDRHSLGHRLDDPRTLEGTPNGGGADARAIECDTLVVGGGIAGMAAALAAAEAGGRVILVERRPTLGGDARFFGTVGEEEAPESAIARLGARIAATPSINVFLRTEGLSLAGTRLGAHQVTASEGRLAGRMLSIGAQRVVLATGAEEHLPIFPGNRAPGVIGTVEAFHRAERYGLWSGRRALFATPNNYGYRLALLAADAGVEVQRVVDSRIDPQSRFIDFCKASGITLASGLIPRSAEPVAKSRELRVDFAVAVEEAGHDAGAVTTDLFVVAGGWQPRLNLWLMAGGRCAYDDGRRWLAAEGDVDGVAIAGAAAGWRSSTACLASATAVVDRLLGRKSTPVVEYEVDAVYESAEAPAPVAPWRAGRGAYLDRSRSFTMRPPPAKQDSPAVALGEIGLLTLGDVVSFVQLGAIPRRDAGVIAQERCIAADEIRDTGWRLPQTPAPSGEKKIPVYLVGRYGPRPQLALVVASDGRRLEAGCLVYPGSTTSDPDAAIGSILGLPPDGKAGALMLASRSDLANASALFVRDTSGAVAIKLVEKL